MSAARAAMPIGEQKFPREVEEARRAARSAAEQRRARRAALEELRLELSAKTARIGELRRQIDGGGGDEPLDSIVDQIATLDAALPTLRGRISAGESLEGPVRIGVKRAQQRLNDVAGAFVHEQNSRRVERARALVDEALTEIQSALRESGDTAAALGAAPALDRRLTVERSLAAILGVLDGATTSVELILNRRAIGMPLTG